LDLLVSRSRRIGREQGKVGDASGVDCSEVALTQGKKSVNFQAFRRGGLFV